jgi:hypothetical protein
MSLPFCTYPSAKAGDAVRRALSKIEAEAGRAWLQEQLDYCTRPLLREPWILDVDTTVKPLYGHQEGAVVGYNPKKPGRPPAFAGAGLHTYHSYMLANLRLVLEVESLPLRRQGFKRATSTRQSIRRRDYGRYWIGWGRNAHLGCCAAIGTGATRV